MKPINLKTIIHNKRASYEYFIEKTFETGLVLQGWEVKSARLKKITIEKNYVIFQKKEAYAHNIFFQSNNTNSLQKQQHTANVHKLLLNKHEISFLTEKTIHQGYTVIILELYWKLSWIKARIGLVKGKKKYDKRNTISSQKWKYEKEYIMKYTNK